MASGMLRFLIAAALASITSSALAQAPPATPAFSPEQSRAIEQTVHDYLLSHPELIIEVLQEAKEKQKEDRVERARDSINSSRGELLDDPGSPVGGNPKGDVTIIEFFDYRCPYCKAVEPSIEALLREDANLRIVYKEYPILGTASVFAARVALAARKQNKYDKFHEAMMATKGEAAITVPVVLGIARSVGLDLDKLKADVLSPDIDAILRRNYALADALNIEGTPGIVIGNAIANGAADVGSLRQMIAADRQPH
jgi:protein-disulfide isomerase